MKVRTEILIGLLLLVGLPLLGVWLAGGSVGRYLEFPPTTQYVEHASFSWWVFGGMAGVLGAVVVAGCGVGSQGSGGRWINWAMRCICGINVGPHGVRPCATPWRATGSGDGATPWRATGNGDGATPWRVTGNNRGLPSAFPWWGWCGVVGGVLAWILAWTRFPWFAGLQMFTFSPQWMAYIVVINALTYWRSGHCLLVDRPRHLVGLFVLSAGFWWFFEYLNRFVQNWYYVGIGTLTSWEYVVFATLPFATVLPAVMSTHEWLATYPRLTKGLDGFRPLVPARPRMVAGLAVALAAAGLAGIGVWPDVLFPVLWIAPLVIIVSLQALAGRETVLGDVVRGDWSRLVRLALAALVCGFFWEMWNYHSLAKWIYTVPYVNRFKVFEMPILGYAGYLPFGWECAVIAGMLDQWEEKVKGVDHE